MSVRRCGGCGGWIEEDRGCVTCRILASRGIGHSGRDTGFVSGLDSAV